MKRQEKNFGSSDSLFELVPGCDFLFPKASDEKLFHFENVSGMNASFSSLNWFYLDEILAIIIQYFSGDKDINEVISLAKWTKTLPPWFQNLLRK